MDVDVSVAPSRSGAWVRVFGGAGVWHAGEPVSVGGPRQQRLLALLAVQAATVVDIDWLAENLWADDDRPADAEGALRTYVSRLRRALPDDAEFAVETVPGGYRLAAPAGAVEHLRFSELRAMARQARERQDPVTAQDLLEEALGLWRGAPFPELEDLVWARAEIERLRQERLEAIEERFEVALALGRHTQIIGELAAFTAEHARRERAWRQYAVALHRAGRTPEALRAIQHFRAELVEVAGLDPSAEMARLEQQLLVGDPALDGEGQGRPLRGYRLLEQIGSGAFSLVWRATQPSVQREVAIKQIRAELATQPAFIRRFEAEAQLVARIEHPHVVPLIDYWRDPDSAYLVMRWLRGGTLEDRLDEGPRSLDDTLKMAAQIGDALAVSHTAGVIHRDVKPANILFDDRGNAYLSDFGIALDAVDSTGPAAALSHGSPAYAAPEQLRRQQLGPATDVFSLAVVIYECLTGTLPFSDAHTADELIQRRLNDPLPPLSSLGSDLPATISAAIERATANDPAERFDNVETFLDALHLSIEPTASAVGTATMITGPVTNPYLGLRAFSEADAGHFHGRDRLVAEVLDRLGAPGVAGRCVVLVGPSGSGKSSVARAGVLPAIRAGRIPGSEAWFTTTMVPGPDPFEALEAALLRVAVNPPPALVGQLRDGPRGILRGVRRCVAADDDRVVVVIDQLEEVFTHADTATAEAFLLAMSVAVEDPATPLRLVATLRADFYDQPLRHPAFAPILKATAVDVTPLAPDELEEAITGPASSLGIGFDGALVTRLAAESLGQPAPLPLLQHTLAELFDHRTGTTITTDAYQTIGGMAGALAARAEQLYDAGTPSELAATRRLFGALVDPIPGRVDLRRRVLIGDLGHDQAITTVIDRFAAARLLTRDHDPQTREPTVEVAHEALLREWPRLQDWLNEDRTLLARLETLRSAADRWADAGRHETDLLRGVRLEAASELAATAEDRLRPVDQQLIDASIDAARTRSAAEARRHRRLRRLTTATAAALVLALIAAVIAIVQRNRADDEAAAAETAALEARAEAARADEQSARAEEQAALAEAARDVAETTTLLSRAEALVRENSPTALLLAVEAYRRDPSTDAQRVLLQVLEEQRGVVSRLELPMVERPSCASQAFGSADGSAERPTEDGWAVFADGTDVVTADPRTGVVERLVSLPGPCAQVSMSWHDGPMVFRTEDEILVQASASDTPVPVLEAPPGLVSLASSGPDRSVIGVVAARSSGQLHLFTESGTPIANPVDSELEFVDLRLARSGEFVLGFERVPNPLSRSRVQLFDARTGNALWSAQLPSQAVDAAWSPSEHLLAIATFRGDAIVLSNDDGSTLATLRTDQGVANSVTFVSDSAVGVMTGSDVEIHELELDGTEATAPLTRMADQRVTVTDGHHVRAIGEGRLAVHSIDRRKITVVRPDSSPLRTVSLPVEPTQRGTVTPGGFAGIVDYPLQTGEVVELATGTVRAIDPSVPDADQTTGVGAASLDEYYLFTVSGVVARVADGDLTARFEPGRLDLPGADTWRAWIAFAHADHLAVLLGGPENRYLAALLSLPDLDPVIVDVGDGVPSGVYPSPDGSSLVVDHADHLAIHGRDGRLTTIEDVTPSEHATFAADPTRELLFRATDVGAVEEIRMSTGTVRVLDRFESPVNVVLSIPDRRLFTSHESGDAWLIDIDAQQRIGRLDQSGAAEAQGAAAVSDDGSVVWMATATEIVGLRLDPDEWIARACQLAGRNLTPEEWDELIPGDAAYRATCDEWPAMTS